MSHRVHPKIFRTKELSDWNSRWVDKKFAQNLEEDFRIREFLKKKLGKIGIEKIEIERFPGKINIIISSARPGLIIGRGGQGVEELKKALENTLTADKSVKAPASSRVSSRAVAKEIRIEIREVKNPWVSATLSAQWVAQQIEKRIHYRRVLKQIIDKIMAQKGVQGCRVEVAGRLGGNEIARREWLKKGRLPRQTLRSDIDYAQVEAYCTYGVVGVKVWIYKGERLD